MPAGDITRPVPNRLILSPMLRILEEQGIARKDILILVATGLHRPNEGAELEELVGPEVAANYRCENHHGKVREEHTFLGVQELVRRGIRADFAIVAEPTQLEIVRAHKGVARLHLTVAGRTV